MFNLSSRFVFRLLPRPPPSLHSFVWSYVPSLPKFVQCGWFRVFSQDLRLFYKSATLFILIIIILYYIIIIIILYYIYYYILLYYLFKVILFDVNFVEKFILFIYQKFDILVWWLRKSKAVFFFSFFRVKF